MTDVIESLYKHFPEPPVSSVVIVFNRDLLEALVSEDITPTMNANKELRESFEDDSVRKLTIHNLRAINDYVEKGLWGGRVLVYNSTSSKWLPGDVASAGLEFDSAIKTSSFAAAINTGYFVNTAGGVLTVTLPSSPSVGDEVHVIDSSNSAATNNITIVRNGNPIASSASDLTVAVNGAAFRLIYSGSATFGWVLMNK